MMQTAYLTIQFTGDSFRSIITIVHYNTNALTMKVAWR